MPYQDEATECERCHDLELCEHFLIGEEPFLLPVRICRECFRNWISLFSKSEVSIRYCANHASLNFTEMLLDGPSENLNKTSLKSNYVKDMDVQRSISIEISELAMNWLKGVQRVE